MELLTITHTGVILCKIKVMLLLFVNRGDNGDHIHFIAIQLTRGGSIQNESNNLFITVIKMKQRNNILK